MNYIHANIAQIYRIVNRLKVGFPYSSRITYVSKDLHRFGAKN